MVAVDSTLLLSSGVSSNVTRRSILETRNSPLTCGAPEGIRTPNLLIRSQMLYPLSYGRLLFNCCRSTGLACRPTRRREDLNLRSPVKGTTH